MKKPKIVSATGISTNSLTDAGKGLAKAIQAAMEEAIIQAAEDGVTDPIQVRERMMSARETVKRASGGL